MMNRKKIWDAYDQLQPTYDQKKHMLDNILSAASERAPAGKDVTMKKYKKNRPLLVAAVLAIMLILVGCAAVVALNLQDMKIGEKTVANSNRDVISLQGIAGTPNQQAAQEWLEYEESYDLDGALIAEADEKNFMAPDAYQAYFVYTQDMIDKVDEICEKYGLKLAGKQALVQRWQIDTFYDALGIESLVNSGGKIDDQGAGYFYECGNFNLEFSFNLTSSEAQWNHPVWTSMRYNGKEYFDTVYCTVEDAASAEQWNYTCADGTEVLMVSMKNGARIFCDRQDAFISVGFDTRYIEDDGSENIMTKRDMELVAEALNFNVKTQKPDMTAAEKALEEAEVNYQSEQEAVPATWENPLKKNSYQELLELEKDNGAIYFNLVDINGDGVEEFFTGFEEGHFSAVYTMKEGKTLPVLINDEVYLCENGVLEVHWVNGDYEVHGYYRMEDGASVLIDYVTYDETADSWANNKNAATTGDTITEAEAKAIIASYVRADLELKLVSEFPEN